MLLLLGAVALLAVLAYTQEPHDGIAGASSARLVLVAPSGADNPGCGPRAHPCATLGKAYAQARPGGVVELLGGTYPAQTIGPGGAKQAASPVVFRPAPGAWVHVAGTIFIFASHVALEHLSVQDVTIGNYDQTAGRPNPEDVRLLGLRGRNFQIDSARDVTVAGGSWGPASACGGPYGGTNNSIRDITGLVPERITITGVTIHDVQSYDLNRCHIEGLAIFAGRRILVERSRFYGNAIYDAFVQANSGPISGLTFRGNWMAMPVGLDGAEDGTVIGFSDVTAGVALIRNRFNYIVSLDDGGGDPLYRDFQVAGNVGVLPYAGCSLRGIAFRGNLWRNGACSRSDISLHGRPLPYRNAANDRRLDYRLRPGVPARWRRLLGP